MRAGVQFVADCRVICVRYEPLNCSLPASPNATTALRPSLTRPGEATMSEDLPAIRALSSPDSSRLLPIIAAALRLCTYRPMAPRLIRPAIKYATRSFDKTVRRHRQPHHNHYHVAATERPPIWPIARVGFSPRQAHDAVHNAVTAEYADVSLILRIIRRPGIIDYRSGIDTPPDRQTIRGSNR